MLKQLRTDQSMFSIAGMMLRKLIGNMVQKIFFRKKYFFPQEIFFSARNIFFSARNIFFSARNIFFSARNIFFPQEIYFFRKKYIFPQEINFSPQEIFFSARNIFVVIGQAGYTTICSVRRKRPKQVDGSNSVRA